VCLGIVGEEEVLVSSVRFDPLSKFRVSYKSEVTFGLVMARFVTEEELLEVCVVENVRVSSPSVVRPLFVFTDKADSVHAH
jgi:hypothetical protein